MSFKDYFFRLYCSTTYVDTWMWLIVTDPNSVVCLSVTVVSPAKTAEPTEMPFGLWTLVGPRNHVLDGIKIAPCEDAIFGESTCRPTCHAIAAANALVCRRDCDGIITCNGRVHLSPRRVTGLANTIKPSICGSNEAFCQITLTTC